jgi:hypothetical protein
MKRMIKLQVFGALVLSSVLILTSCQSGFDEVISHPEFGLEGIVSPVGGTLSLLNGDVTLQFPEGAIDFTEQFSVKTCEDPAECIYLLKMVSIEPYVTFNKPVKLIIRYDGSLMNNPEVFCPGTCATPFFWDNPQDFLGHMPEKSGECCIDPEKKCISMNIMQTGVYAFNKGK